VIFRDNEDKTEQIIPISLYDTRDPEKLGGWMAAYEGKTGGQVLAIPHNGNLSNGLMFDDVTLTTREPIDRDYAERRMRWEPLYEVTQMKGDGEAHSLFSPDDEFAEFETWDRGSFGKETHTDEMLPREYARKVPTFLVRALRDVDWANLDRVQIVKGWLDEGGETVEKVYDIAVSDGRKIGADGRSKDPVGNTVNVKAATYTNSIGAAVMQAYWQDPDFDPEQRAFYYVRVIEIPTPRWTTYDAKIFGVKLPEDVSTAIQDRAYTSPIWYTP
jgi:hypothetical protein